jgi:diadenosine tetraphosphate (Ap4A) HIT family hydrolase
MGNILRTKELKERYKSYREAGGLQDGCALCAKPTKQIFRHWKVVVNEFPYDLIAESHDMIIPVRHVTEKEITTEEWQEYQTIKADFIQQYDYIIEATNKTKSIPEHFHLHLIVGKQA